MRRFPLVLAFCVLGVPVLPAADDGPLTPEKAKALIPEAAGVPSDELMKLSSAPDITTVRVSGGDVLTFLVLSYKLEPDAPKNPTSFRFLDGQLNPAKLASTISGPKDKDGKYRKYASLIQPEYITDCTCKVDGNTATGTVTFKVEKLYEGKVEYTARKKDGKWRIEEFRLPDLKITTALGADGKWVKK